MNLAAVTTIKFYKWHVSDETGSHCGRCKSWNGQTKSGDEWDLLARPPLHPNCHCWLELVHTDIDGAPGTPPDGGSGQGGGDGPLDPDDDAPSGENKPQNPPATPPTVPPKGPTPKKPPPPPKKPKCAICGGPHLTKACRYKGPR